MKKILLIILSLILVTGCGCSKNEETKNNQVDNSQTSVADSKAGKLDIVDFVAIYEDGISEVYYTIENNTEEDLSYDYITCETYDKDDNLVYIIKIELGTIKAGESKDIDVSVTVDLSKVTKAKYSVE